MGRSIPFYPWTRSGVLLLKIDFPISILCAVLLLILGAAGMSLGHIDGVVFIILFLAFILYMIRSAQTSREKNVEPGVEEEEYLLEAEEIQEMSMGKSVRCRGRSERYDDQDHYLPPGEEGKTGRIPVRSCGKWKRSHRADRAACKI